jgi:hypothetical protein
MDERSDDRPRGERLEQALATLLYEPEARERLRAGEADDPRLRGLDVDELDEAARGVVRMVRERVHRGMGGVEAWFPRTIAAWRGSHPDDRELDELFTRFCASPSCRSWRELGVGISLEEAFYRFLVDACVAPPAILEDEFSSAVVRALAITPKARFAWPEEVRRVPGGCYALTRERVLHAALDGKYVHGPVTPLVAALLEGEPPQDVARRHGLGEIEIAGLTKALRTRGLVP